MPNYDIIRAEVRKFTKELRGVKPNECFNDVLINLHKYIHTYDQEKSLKTWLYTVTKRTCFQIYKDNLSDVITESLNTIKKGQILPSQTPHNRLLTISLDNLPLITSDALYKAILSLPPKHSTIIFMVANGYSHKEMHAELVEAGELITMGCINQRIRTARKLIKNALKNHYQINV